MKQIFTLAVILAALSSNAQTNPVTCYTFDPGKVNKKLSSTLDSLYQEDQRYRMELSKLKKENAPKSVVDSLSAIIKTKDNSNLAFVEKWINKHGWLGPEEIGFMGVQAVFLVIQHADLKTQKKYYPMLKKAEREGNILSSNVALIEDRIAIREGRNQTYGSQFYVDPESKKNIVYPLENVEDVDRLRKSVGLQPMKEYVKDWSIESYTSNLPEAALLLKKSKSKNNDRK